RQVRYPWHPWFGRSVTVYETLNKRAHPVCRCGVDDQRHDRLLEVPAWMFEPAGCDQLRLAGTPIGDCQALSDLKSLLEAARRGELLQAQLRSWGAVGGADATIESSSTRLAPAAVSPATPTPAISDLPVRHPGHHDSAAGTPAAPAGRPPARGR